MRSLRARITLASTAVLVVVLALAAVLIVELVDRQLRDELAEQNERTLTELTGRIEAGEDPRNIRLPLATDGTEFIITTGFDEWVNSTLTVLADDEVPDDAVIDGTADEIVIDFFPDDQGEWSITEVSAVAPDGTVYRIEALNPTTIVDRTVGQVRAVLWVVIPALAAVFAALVWLLTGRVLGPVDRITAKARRIRTDTLHERIDEPGTDDEIDRLAKTLNEMLDRLDHGARAQRQFVSDASHELRSPLTVLLGEAELAATNPTPGRLEAANGHAVEHGHRMLALIEDLLDLARADEAGLRRVEVDLDEVLRSEAKAETVQGGGVVDTSGVAPARIVGDEGSLARVFRNLIDNGRRHGGGRVEVGCRVVGGSAVVTIDDDGPGIAPQDRAGVFDRFARLDESRTRATGGTGLGLAIVKAVVEGHGGTVEIDASPLGGARFTVRLPVANTPASHGVEVNA